MESRFAHDLEFIFKEHITWEIRTDLGCTRVYRFNRNGWIEDLMSLRTGKLAKNRFFPGLAAKDVPIICHEFVPLQPPISRRPSDLCNLKTSKLFV